MAVGPQYQSQLALLAGALGHGLDPNQGYQMYQQTIASAQAAQQQRQQEIQDTQAKLADIATSQAMAGASPDQLGALVRSAEAGLPHGGSQAVIDARHHILGQLADYQYTPDPMTAAQLQGEKLSNALKMQQLTGGGTLDPSQEDFYGPAHQQQVASMVDAQLQQASAMGKDPDFGYIRNLVAGQVGPQVAPSAANGVPTPQVIQAINATISAEFAKLRPGWAAQNIQAYAPNDLTPPSPVASPVPSPVVDPTQQTAVNRVGGYLAAYQ